MRGNYIKCIGSRKVLFIGDHRMLIFKKKGIEGIAKFENNSAVKIYETIKGV